jgi:enoyl-CoA hydratase/carnithine racemase
LDAGRQFLRRVAADEEALRWVTADGSAHRVQSPLGRHRREDEVLEGFIAVYIPRQSVERVRHARTVPPWVILNVRQRAGRPIMSVAPESGPPSVHTTVTVRPVLAGDVKVGVDGGIVTVTIDRPTKRNALTQAMYGTMADALQEADEDDRTGAVVITGVDDVFTAGNDLVDFASGGSLDEVVRFLATISSVRVPIVAAVNGLAIGVGLTMLLHCDLVYVDPKAELSTPFVELGLVPEAAASLLLPRVIGERRASEVILSGRHIDGVEAAAWGLANEAVAPALDAALRAARRLAIQPPKALRSSKALLRSQERTVQGRMEEEMRAFTEALGGAEFAEIISTRRQAR